MAIPNYQACMLPLLEILADGQQHRIPAVVSQLADHFGLSEAERAQRLPSGQQRVISNRVGWAKTYLKKAGLLTNPTRGTICISPKASDSSASNLRSSRPIFSAATTRSASSWSVPIARRWLRKT